MVLQKDISQSQTVEDFWNAFLKNQDELLVKALSPTAKKALRSVFFCGAHAALVSVTIQGWNEANTEVLKECINTFNVKH